MFVGEESRLIVCCELRIKEYCKMGFQYRQFEKEFEKRMKELEKAHRNGDCFKTVCYLRYLSDFYYTINYKFTDERLEQITKEVSLNYLGKTEIVNVNEDTVMFYDGFGLARRGLANIYVNALDRLGYKTIWILYDFAPDVDIIQEQFKNRKNVTFYIIPKKTILERMELLRNCLKETAPKHLLVYTTPSDIGGLGAISTVEGNVTRYMVDLTDHAFWIGKCAVDYVIGFRNLGYNIAVQYRHFEPDKVMILPYYPDARDQDPFEGMPFDVSKYEYVFSGGAPYKLEGSDTYKEMATYILKRYTDLRFVYAGNGRSQVLEELSNEFPGRFFWIPERKDLDEVLKHARFYLSTYPLGGSLMTQYALQNKCIPFCLCDDEWGVTDPRTWLLESDTINFVFNNKEDLLNEIDRIMSDDNYYVAQKARTSGLVISEEEFTQQLQRILKEKTTEFVPKRNHVNIDNFLDTYKRRATYEEYCNIIYGSRNKWVYRKHPIIVRRQKRIAKKNTISGEGNRNDSAQ